MTPAEPGGSPRTWHPHFLADWEIRDEIADPATTADRRAELQGEAAGRVRERAEAAERESLARQLAERGAA